MTGEQLYKEWQQIHTILFDCSMDDWENIGSMEQDCWVELARRLDREP